MKYCILATLAALGLVVPMNAQDVIYFSNGDRVTGKIKTLGRGQLVLDAPAMDGDVKIDWTRISRIDSKRTFQFQTRDGERFSGYIAKDAESGAPVDEVLIVSPGRPSPPPGGYRGSYPNCGRVRPSAGGKRLGYNFDTQPPENTRESDYVTMTSMTYSFP